MIQGSLFTRDFLCEGITSEPAWQAIDNASVAAARAILAPRLSTLARQRDPNEAETESSLVFPTIAQTLDWPHWLPQQNQSVRGRDDVPDALLFADAAALDQARPKPQWQRYQHGLCLVEAKRWNRPLDRPGAGSGENIVPSAQVLRYLRRAGDITNGELGWGILTNGRHWRLYWQRALSVSEDFFEIDLGKIFGLPGCEPDLLDGRLPGGDHALRLFLLIFGRKSFLPTEGGQAFHQIALTQGRRWEERVARDLSRLVFERVFPDLAAGLAMLDRAHPGGETSLNDVRQGALILLYRLLFVLYAEDRDLLPVGRDSYQEYSLTRMRQEIAQAHSNGRQFSRTATVYWARLRGIFEAVAHGDDALGIPAYNGGLFESAAAPILDRVQIPDRMLASLLFTLSHVADECGPKYVNYRDLSVQQLGSIYERILEFGLRREPNGDVVVDRSDAERHDSGSYYTPEALVSLIIERAVGPSINAAVTKFAETAERLQSDRRPTAARLAELHRADPASAMLELKICDPAMGSGHFLVSLVDWLADRIQVALADAPARVPWADYVSPLLARVAAVRARILAQAQQHGWPITAEQLDDRHVIRRMILKRVIHGVDKNPFAVELAKVTLWLHTFTVGAPLSFLDHHLRCGDSIVGAWSHQTLDEVRQVGGLLSGQEVAKVENIASAMDRIESITDNDISEVRSSVDEFGIIRDTTRPLDAFFGLMTARHALDVDLSPKLNRPRDTLENLRRAGAGARALAAAEKKWAAYERAAAFKAVLAAQFGDPLSIASGDLPIEPVAEDDGQLAFEGVSSARRQNLAAALVGQARAFAARERFVNWEIAFPNTWRKLTQEQPEGGFDAVIGNPPYVRQEKLTALKPMLEAGYDTYAGTADLYVYFFEQGLRLTKPGGRVGYVVTNKWLKSGYAAALRGLLADPAKCETETVIDFGHARAFFPDADVFPSVVVLRRPTGDAVPESLTVAVPSRETLPDERLGETVAKASFPLIRTALEPDGWVLEPKPVMELLAKIRRAGTPLAEYAGVRPCRGVLTGLNDAFIIDPPTRDRLIAADPNCAEIIKPYLRGQDIHRWASNWAGQWMIFARRGIEIDQYPAIKEHLQQYKARLAPRPESWGANEGQTDWGGRKPGAYEWYELQDSIDYYQEFDKPKLIYSDITWSATFALDRNAYYINNTTYFVPVDDLWLIAVLNAPIGWWWSWRTAQHGKDEALRYFNTFVERYPIPACRNPELPVDQLAKLSKNVVESRTALHDWLRVEMGSERIGRALENPERLDSDAFVAAVRAALPRRRQLSAAEIVRLRREHTETIEPARAAARKILELERRLSDLVNVAYGLTPEEVQLMWSTAPPRMPFEPA